MSPDQDETAQLENSLVAEIENRHMQPDLCTIYPLETDEIDRMSMWITAREGSFVSLQEMR